MTLVLSATFIVSGQPEAPKSITARFGACCSNGEIPKHLKQFRR
jgi:hypothetical protein